MSDFKNLPMKGKHLINLLAVVAALCYSAQSNGVTPNDQTPCKTGPDNNYIQIKLEGKCCDSCRPGTYMVQLCLDNDPSSTLCKECDPETYTAGPNLADSCFPQYHCWHNEIPLSVGSTTSKAKCVCRPGYTRSPEGGCRRVYNWRPTTTIRDPPTTPRQAKTEIQASSPHNEIQPEPGSNNSEDTKQPVIVTEPKGADGRDIYHDGTEDRSEYGGTDEDVKSGSTLEGKHIVVIIVVPICSLCAVSIVAIAIVYGKKRIHHTHSGDGHMPYQYQQTSTNYNGYIPGSGEIPTSSSPSVVDLIDLEGGAHDNMLNTGSTTAVAMKESHGPTSPNSSQNLEDSDALGLNDTQKPKSTTSINNLVKAVHGSGCLEPSTETSQ